MALAERAVEEVRTRSWGTVDTMGELPEPLPTPPSARRLWSVVGVLAVVALLTGAVALRSAMPPRDAALEADFTPGRGGIWSGFDVDDRALVTIVRESGGVLDVVMRSESPADKMALAVGDGSYRLHSMGSAVLIASTSAPLSDVDAMVESASGAPDPLSDLGERILAADPDADLRSYRVR